MKSFDCKIFQAYQVRYSTKKEKSSKHRFCKFKNKFKQKPGVCYISDYSRLNRHVRIFTPVTNEKSLYGNILVTVQNFKQTYLKSISTLKRCSSCQKTRKKDWFWINYGLYMLRAVSI